MTTAAILPRQAKAIGIITRAECIPLDDDTWKVRDTATGSGAGTRPPQPPATVTTRARARASIS